MVAHSGTTQESLTHTHTHTHTHTNHTRKFITHTQETWVCPRDSDFTSLWDIARVLRFCSAAEIEKD